MRRSRRLVRFAAAVPAVVVLMSTGACSAWAQGTASRGASTSQAFAAAQAATRALAVQLRDSLDLPGLAVAVAVPGEVVAAENLGWAEIESRKPVDPMSQWRIGSVSKLLTSAVAARLVQAGRLDLDAPIGRYLPDLPPDKARLTPRQLAGHLSGMGHYGASDYVNTTVYSAVSESLPPLLAQPLLSPPGERYSYSSYGYNVLGAVLEAAAGKEFRRLVHDEVLTPLGLRSTTAEVAVNPPPGLVRFYSRDSVGLVIPATAADVSDRWPSGGYLSTAADLARFGTAILDPSFLDLQFREALFTSQRLPDARETGVGMAWRIGRDVHGRRYVHHGGDSVGSRAFLLVYPDHGVSVAMVSNVTFAPLGERQALAFAAPFLP